MNTIVIICCFLQVIRKDKDVQRLRNFQEIELVATGSHGRATSLSSGILFPGSAAANGYQSIHLFKNQTILYQHSHHCSLASAAFVQFPPSYQLIFVCFYNFIQNHLLFCVFIVFILRTVRCSNTILVFDERTCPHSCNTCRSFGCVAKHSQGVRLLNSCTSKSKTVSISDRYSLSSS